MKDTIEILIALLILLLIPFAIYMHYNAPCDSFWFAHTTATELPARCVTYFNR